MYLGPLYSTRAALSAFLGTRHQHHQSLPSLVRVIMLFIGLTGSIATGKSTVSSLLASPPYNLPVIDADLLARKVVEPGEPAYNKIIAYFSSSTPDLLVPVSDETPEKGTDGKGRPLNRPALGRRVFGDSDERKRDRAKLNSIVHPAVRREMYKGILRAYSRGHWACVLDIPLLFESRLDELCGVVLVVGVRDPEVQMSRLMQRDAHLTREDAENRVRSQGNVVEKTQRCVERGEGKGIVLWNDGSKEDLKHEVAMAMQKLRSQNPAWWQVLLLLCPPLAIAMAGYRYWDNTRINSRWNSKQEKARL